MYIVHEINDNGNPHRINHLTSARYRSSDHLQGVMKAMAERRNRCDLITSQILIKKVKKMVKSKQARATAVVAVAVAKFLIKEIRMKRMSLLSTGSRGSSLSSNLCRSFRSSHKILLSA